MQFIALQNFKSYERQLINNLNPHINIIIGKNGQGKSNFFKAISFALTNRINLNKSQYITHKHRAIVSENRAIKVELYAKTRFNQQKYDENIQHMQRIWQSDSIQEFRADDKLCTAHQYQNYVQSLGFSYSNPYNIIQQGKITQITLMDEFQIYKLLEEATGIKKIDKRLQQALEYLKKNEETKSDFQNLLKEIQTRLNSYHQKREEYEYYSYEEKANKIKNKVQFQTMINKFDSEIKGLKEKEARTYDELTKLKLGLKDKQQDLEELNDKISVNQKQMYSFVDTTMDDDLLNVSVNLSQDNKETAAKIKKISMNKEKLKKQLQKATSQVEKVKQEMKPYKEKYDYLTMQLQAMKSSKLGLSKGKQELKNQINKSDQHVKQIQSELKKVIKMRSEFKIAPGTVEINEISLKKQKLSQIHNELRANKIKYFESSRLKNQYQSEMDIAKQHIEVNYSKMRKLLPALDFNLLNELRKQKVQGVYGFLVEFLTIETDFLFAYEISGLNKLCTLLVQNEQVCTAVVNLNKRLKGRQINILPMSFVKKMANAKKAIPQIDDCFSLLNDEWVKVKPHSYGQQFTKLIDKIVSNTFGGHLLVKDYDLGLKVSKQFHLNCITADKEIVYSEGYLCKVGKDANVDDRLQAYLKYEEKNLQSQRVSGRLAEVTKEVMELQNVQLDLMKKKVQLQSQIRNAELKLELINEQKRSLSKIEEQIKNLQQKKGRYQQDIKKKTEILNNYDKKGQININMNEYKETEQLYKAKLKLYNQKSEQQCQLQNKLLEIIKEEEQLNEQVKNINSQLSFQKEFNVSFVATKEFQHNLQQTNQKLSQQKQTLQAEILKISETYAQKQTQNYNFLGQIALMEDEIRYYQDKIEEIGTLDMTKQQIEQKSNSFSLSISRIDQKRKMRLFSAGQKLMFAKIDSYIEKYKDSVKKLKQLEQHESHINDMIHNFQAQKNQIVANIFTKFERCFDTIFKAITLHGKTDIRLKKITDRSRGIIKTKNSIAIMVSFAGQTTKTWNQFSGGQKTVIAICLLMALQKCEPAPFYILDEVDSALDQAYLQRIVKLIEAESERSQYFITTFKKQMLNMKEQKCNYYLVQNTNRVSTIERISLERAREAMGDFLAG